jgi:hypothetical protein
MSGSPISVRFPTLMTAVFAAAVAFATPAPAQRSGPFNGLAGSWNGGGSIAIGSETHERIRCRADYQVGSAGATATILLRCASDSYTFELQSNVYYQNGEVLGNWSERTRGTGGRIVGSVKGDQIDVRIEGQSFSALLKLTTRGDKQAISIKGSVGSQMSEANITLNRRG